LAPPATAIPAVFALILWMALKISRMAVWTLYWTAGAGRHAPAMSAILAQKLTFGHHNIAPLDLDIFLINQGVGDFPVGAQNNVAEGLPGNVHTFGGLFLVQSLLIGQPDSFEFVQCQDDGR
jgi:hypothetical protein